MKKGLIIGLALAIGCSASQFKRVELAQYGGYWLGPNAIKQLEEYHAFCEDKGRKPLSNHDIFYLADKDGDKDVYGREISGILEVLRKRIEKEEESRYKDSRSEFMR